MAAWRRNQDLVLESEASVRWRCQVDGGGKYETLSRGLSRREKFRSHQHIDGI